MEQQDVLQDIEQEIYLERASVGARFVNLLIDSLVFYVFEIIALLLLYRIGILSPYGNDDAGTSLGVYLVLLILFVGYFTIIEGASKGRTLGKLITGTHVVTLDGSSITWNDALMRSLSRLVPFEPFSAFGGSPWHDKWTKTMVIKNSK